MSKALALSRRLAAVALVAGYLALWPADYSLVAAEPLWQSDQTTAAAQARKQGKLLLVVHLSADFATNSAESPEAKLYRTLTLTDSRVAAALTDRFVVTYRNVGDAKSLPRMSEAAKGRAPLEMAIAYVCLPDERVLHFVPGFLSPGELAAELEWVESSYARLVKTGDAQMPGILRELHRKAVDDTELKPFTLLFESRWLTDPSPDYSTVDLPQAIAAAQTVWQMSQQQRLGARATLALNEKDKESLRSVLGARPTRPSALAAHGRLGTEFAHLVLSEFPLIYLSDLARPSYEACTGRRFWEASSRRKELADWWSTCRQASRKTLLIVADDVFAPAVAPKPEPPKPPPPEDSETSPDLELPNPPQPLTPEEASALAKLWRVDTRVVSIDELAQLLSDANVAPLEFDAATGPPRFMVHDARGFRCAEVAASEASADKLESALRTAVHPGAAETLLRKAGVLEADVLKSGVKREETSDE